MRAFLDFVTHDWYFAVPLLALSVFALALVIWRLVLNMQAGTDMSEFLPQFQERLEKEGIPGALRFCQARTDVIPHQLYQAGLETAPQGLAAMRRAMANVIELEILPDLNYLLNLILAIAKIATMLGLLATVLSMIQTFNAIQGAGAGGAVGHAGSIGLALFGTALGLITAIPLVFAHVLFKGWIAKFEIKMKSAAQKLLLLVQSSKPPGGISKTSSGLSTVEIPVKAAKP
jgi:biopolymer transport protein ExbB